MLHHAWGRTYFGVDPPDRVLLDKAARVRITSHARSDRALPILVQAIDRVHKIHERDDLIRLLWRQRRRQPWHLDARNWLLLLGNPSLKTLGLYGEQRRNDIAINGSLSDEEIKPLIAFNGEIKPLPKAFNGSLPNPMKRSRFDRRNPVAPLGV